MAITQNELNRPDYLTDYVNRWLLHDLLKVDKIFVDTWFDATCGGYKVMYRCMKGGKVVCRMEFDDGVPIKDRITAMQIALRIEDGNHTEGQESSPAKTT